MAGALAAANQQLWLSRCWSGTADGRVAATAHSNSATPQRPAGLGLERSTIATRTVTAFAPKSGQPECSAQSTQQRHCSSVQ